MKKLCLILFTVPIYTAGCTSTFTVHVNGFSEFDRPVSDKASIYVAVDPNSRNPIFDKEIKGKIEILLKSHGYFPAAEIEQADYRLTFHAGLDSHRVAGYTPLYRPYFGFHDRYWADYHFGYTGYVPYFETFYSQWLVMKVFSTGRDDTSQAGKVVWIGEAMTDTGIADLRRVVDYLLVAGFEYFGADTKRKMVLKISTEDPRIIQIAGFR